MPEDPLETARHRCPCESGHDLAGARRVDALHPGSHWTADDLNAWFSATHEHVRVAEQTLIDGTVVVAYREGPFVVWVEPGSHTTGVATLDLPASEWTPSPGPSSGVELADAFRHQVEYAARLSTRQTGRELRPAETPYSLLVAGMVSGHVPPDLPTEALVASWVYGGFVFYPGERTTIPNALAELDEQLLSLIGEASSASTVEEELAAFLAASGHPHEGMKRRVDHALNQHHLHAATLAEFGRWRYGAGRPARGHPQQPLLGRLDHSAERQLTRRAERLLEAWV